MTKREKIRRAKAHAAAVKANATRQCEEAIRAAVAHAAAIKANATRKCNAAIKGTLTMRALLVSALGIFAVLAVMAQASAESRTRSFYDHSGRFAGSSVERGNSTSVYDHSGRFDGSIIRNSNGTSSYYDGRGRFTGSSTDTSPRR